ncbi:MAG: class I SAM-dependent methyltransferase [Candidatus Eremiobacteraeota bacterium]|nr:class I SAM-dependent methyltransferase [Candidatus Eremiobacteraeota bacterium]
MSSRTIDVTERLYEYVLDVSFRDDPVLRELREETAKLPEAGMQIGPDQGQFMALLVRAIDARRALEIGVFTGYSSIVVARALPEHGKLIACDVSPEYTAIARRYWAKAGVEKKIDLRLGPAIDTLDFLIADGGSGTIDFAFIDADKPNYDAYYERVLHLMRPRGVIAFDNVLWSGRVADAKEKDTSTVALRELNAKLGKDDRVDVAMLTIGDGVTLACKR